MTSVDNSTGTIEFGPAVARGVPTQSGLRGVAELAATDTGPLAVPWRDTAVVAGLGQLAATDAAANQKILRGACAVARFRHSFAGLESVFLSALLGAPPDAAELATAENLWNTVERPAGTGDDLLPVLDSRSRELCFLTRVDIGSLTAFELRAQLAELCRTRPVAPGSTEDLLAFGTHLVVAASAVASAQLIRAMPDASAYRSPATAVIPAADRSDGLPQQLLSGTALLVQVCLLQGGGLPAAAGPWRSVWPATPVLPVDDPAVEHPFWTTARLCPAWPPVSPPITTLLVRRGDTLVLPALPRFDPDGTAAEHGFYPRLDGEQADEGRAWRLRTPRPRTLRLPPYRDIDLTGLHVDPLTGQLVDALGNPVGPAPSQAFGEFGAVSATRDRLVATARDADLSSNTRLDTVVDRITGVRA
ncbi:hypothetical protein [Actinophytocola sp.]|uniref:hypothetical protein n=1 Tax=Actinophytocola sp. TaxID=1872138 RepID=UPI002D81126B|nr:hypothetical protein [Actinophytocola sp.]HET9143366.1 hypothetical protein [Actinophytocola sp.]